MLMKKKFNHDCYDLSEVHRIGFQGDTRVDLLIIQGIFRL